MGWGVGSENPNYVSVSGSDLLGWADEVGDAGDYHGCG
jgi:hypothetical protein